jgi:outer membrane receptor protein involved in Fe transport
MKLLKEHQSKIVLLCGLMAGAAVSTTVHANDSIEVISVTATKQNSSLQDVPASLSLIDVETLELIEAQHINQVLARVAGTWISRGNGQEHLTAIRSPVLTGAGSCGAFFMALDGISLRAPGFCNANQLFDANSEQAARIEVLKGPASTLYGTNALHGAINIISPDAFGDNANELSLQLGAYDFARISGEYNWQQDNEAFAVLSNLTQENGYQSESGYDQQKITAVYQRQGQQWNNKTVLDTANLNQETAGFIRGFKTYEDEDFRRINPNPEAYRDAKSLRAYSEFSRELNDGTFSVTPYVRWNEMAFLQHFLPWQALEENTHSSLGVQTQYNFDGAGASWLTGVDLDLTQANLGETQERDFSPSVPAGEHYDYDVNANLIAAYAQGTWQFDSFSVIAGLRAERLEYDYDNLLSNGSACASNVAVCRFTRPSDQTLSFSSLSETLTIEYTALENWLLYSKYANGYRAPEATELFRLQNNQTTADLDEVSMQAFELGARYSLDAHTLHIAAYDMQKENVIIRDTNRQNIAGGETQHQGFEVEYRWQISDAWRFSSNATWQKHTYKSDLAIANVSIKGNRIDTSPNQLYGAQLFWQASSDISAELAWQYLSDYFLDPENTAEYDGHSLFDFTLRYAISDNVTTKLNILNITDEDYAERADFAFGDYRYFIGQPRRIFASVNWKF